VIDSHDICGTNLLHHSSRPVHHRSLCYCLDIYIQVSGIITNQNIITKKAFLNRERAIPTAETPSVSRTDIHSTSRNIPLSEQLTFRISDETSKSFPKFNATGRSLLIKFNSRVRSKILLLI